MNHPKVTLLGLTWVGWLNFLVAQWAFVRIGYGPGGWRLIRRVWPLTGWWSPYRFIE